MLADIKERQLGSCSDLEISSSTTICSKAWRASYRFRGCCCCVQFGRHHGSCLGACQIDFPALRCLGSHFASKLLHLSSARRGCHRTCVCWSASPMSNSIIAHRYVSIGSLATCRDGGASSRCPKGSQQDTQQNAPAEFRERRLWLRPVLFVRVSVLLRRGKQLWGMFHHVRVLLLEETHFLSSFADHRGRTSERPATRRRWVTRSWRHVIAHGINEQMSQRISLRILRGHGATLCGDGIEVPAASLGPAHDRLLGKLNWVWWGRPEPTAAALAL